MAAPVDPPAPTPEATPPAAPQLGPWAADLAEYLGDNQEAIAAVDRYMREKVQPSRTQFEQETAPARELYKDLLADPEATLAAVVEELYADDRPEVVEKFASLFAEETPPESPAAEPETPGNLTKEQQELLAWAEEKRRAEADEAAQQEAATEYEQTLSELREAHTDLTDADIDLIHPFIAAAGGDTEAAYAGYQAFLKQFQETHGVTPTEAAAAEETPAPPPVLGAQAAAAATPPTEKKYRNIDDALDDYFAEKRAVAPPVVGSA